jgi:hypothetical protein
MTKAIFHVRPIPQRLARALSLVAILAVLVLSVGGALAERLEQRAEQDRFCFGGVTYQV